MAKTVISPLSDDDDGDDDFLTNEIEMPLLPTKEQQQNHSPNIISPPSQSPPNLPRDPFPRLTILGPSSIDFEDPTTFASKSTTASTSAREGERLQNPRDLHAYITNHLSVVPPEIYIRVRGTHRESSSAQQGTNNNNKPIVDFDFVVSMRGIFAPEHDQQGRTCSVVEDDIRTYRGGVIETRGERTPGVEGGRDLLEWCSHYCSDTSFRKQFRVTRTLAGYDFAAIKAGVTLLLRPGYLGKLEIGFTVVDEHVDICPPGLVRKLNAEHKRHELASTIVLVPVIVGAGFGLTVLLVSALLQRDHVWSFLLRGGGMYLGAVAGVTVAYFVVHAVVLAVLDTRKWHAYKVNWAVATVDETTSAKRYAGLTEAQWMEKNAAMLRRLVEGRFEGDATSFVDAPLGR